MIRNVMFIQLILFGITLSASCSPAQTTSTPVPNMPNPAVVYCEQHGGNLEIVTAVDGSQSGLCVFPDGSRCDDWAYFRGECKPTDSLVTPGPKDSLTPVSTLTAPTAAPATQSPVSTLKPSVLRVAYYGGSLSACCHIMLWTEGEGSRQVADATNVEQVRISDDGQVIAYTSRYSHGGYEILAVNADSTHQQVLVGWDYLKNFQPINSQVFFDFVPASHTLYFVTDQNDLHRVNADDGVPSRVLGTGQGGRFTFSPDGHWMILYHPREMILARSDGSAARGVYKWDPDSCADPQIAWARDSAGFRMLIPTDAQDSPNLIEIWYFPINGDPVKQMAYAGPCGTHLSPDGRTAVYLDERHTPVDVHIVTMDGNDSIYGSYSGSYNPWFMGWAPDSKHFLLNLSKEDLRLEVPYLCAAGEEPARLTDIDDANAVVWIDAERVLFDRRGGSLHLQRVGTPSILLDANASSSFDYALINP